MMVRAWEKYILRRAFWPWRRGDVLGAAPPSFVPCGIVYAVEGRSLKTCMNVLRSFVNS